MIYNLVARQIAAAFTLLIYSSAYVYRSAPFLIKLAASLDHDLFRCFRSTQKRNKHSAANPEHKQPNIMLSRV